MDRITMAFGPISDVTGFSHKAGMTYLEIQELLRRKINELIVAYANLKSHVEARNGDLQSAFDEGIASIQVPAAEYAAIVADLEQLQSELSPYATTSTDYITA